MPFITLGNLSHYLSPHSANCVMVAGQGKHSTRREAAAALSRLVKANDSRMNEANEEYELIYEDTIAVKGAFYAE